MAVILNGTQVIRIHAYVLFGNIITGFNTIRIEGPMNCRDDGDGAR
jgi:hypothetical protein